MNNKDGYILTATICRHYAIEHSFLESLSSSGLIHVVTIEPDNFIHEEEIGRLEKMIRISRDLELNVDSLEIVLNLLERIESLQRELDELKYDMASREAWKEAGR